MTHSLSTCLFVLAVTATASSDCLAQYGFSPEKHEEFAKTFTKFGKDDIDSMSPEQLRIALRMSLYMQALANESYEETFEELCERDEEVQARLLPLTKERQESLSVEEQRELLEDEEVLHKIKPFTTPGRWQPGDLVVDENSRKVPISLSRIKRSGALERTGRGLSRLAAIVNQGGLQISDEGPFKNALPQLPVYYTEDEYGIRRHIDTDRPKWGEAFVTKDHYCQLDTRYLLFLRDTQILLIELGDTMVKDGLLSP